MVDFKKRLATKPVDFPTDPIEIYARLDRASDKGPLRPAQTAVLSAWHAGPRASRDVVLKLHTGEGKTLLGLLMLQAKLHEARSSAGSNASGGDARALYLCPNHFLVNQTLAQAKQFGVRCVPVDSDGGLPAAFYDGRAILVAPVQKLFNGMTKFGLGAQSERVDAIVLDDAHACIDAIKDACIITLKRDHLAYSELVGMFAADLQQQGAGRYAEIRARDAAAFVPVPYWAWSDRHHDVAAILAKHTATKAVKFAWPLLRDGLRDCQCVVSGRELVIAPYRAPLEQFGSYAEARHRVFMSATISDDSFLVQGLGLEPKVVEQPLTHAGSAWSGEKMVVIPSDIDDSLTATEIVHRFAKPNAKRTYGIVAIVPSFEASKDWETEGATVADADAIDSEVELLRGGAYEKTLVVANRYDGIDLPDDTCRILIVDGKPFGESLLDQYIESCRPESDAIAMRVTRTIEQGMGRAVRGEKDYCVILLTGTALVRTVRTREGRHHFSPQTRAQLEIGLTISGLAREEIATSRGTVKPTDALQNLVRQSIGRDEGWKDYYVEQMNDRLGVGTSAAPSVMTALGASATAPMSATPRARLRQVFAAELKAAREYESGDVDGAVATLQALIDNKPDGSKWSPADRGWYIQEMARYRYITSKSESATLQAAAHRQNRFLLRPKDGVTVTRLEPASQRRAERILAWLGQHANYATMIAVIDDLVSALRFGTRAETFEQALHDIGHALGFACERPDAEWKEGPDNLWALRDGEYLVIECKSEVETTRAEIHKQETGQMNNSCAWFAREYPGARSTNVLVIPARKVANAAGFNESVVLMRQGKLHTLTANVRRFFGEFRTVDMRDVSETKIQELLQHYHLRTDDLQTFYYEQPREP
jgi:replicative superfamily II helicase